MAESDEWLGVTGAARSPRSYWWYVRASGWRQARPDAVGTVNYEVAGPKPLVCGAMADPRRFELEELVNRPGTYFNPQTEVLVIVDDSPELDAEIFNMEEFEGADWVLISDEVPVEEDRRDELLQTFQAHHAPDGAGADPDEEPEEYEEEQEELGRE